eukprot:5613315-Lingulodinium_polyedra.AAC.1
MSGQTRGTCTPAGRAANRPCNRRAPPNAGRSSAGPRHRGKNTRELGLGRRLRRPPTAGGRGRSATA